MVNMREKYETMSGGQYEKDYLCWWKDEFWNKAKENIKKNYNPYFVYDMSSLRNAESMFAKKQWYKENDNPAYWPDDIKHYTLTNFKSTGNDFNIPNKRIYDFERIYLKAPKLISAPMMFWGTPLRAEEVEYFANNVQDLNSPMEFSSNNIRKFFTRITNVENPTIREAFDLTMKMYSYENIVKAYDEDYV